MPFQQFNQNDFSGFQQEQVHIAPEIEVQVIFGPDGKPLFAVRTVTSVDQCGAVVINNQQVKLYYACGCETAPKEPQPTRITCCKTVVCGRMECIIRCPKCAPGSSILCPTHTHIYRKRAYCKEHLSTAKKQHWIKLLLFPFFEVEFEDELKVGADYERE